MFDDRIERIGLRRCAWDVSVLLVERQIVIPRGFSSGSHLVPE